MLKCEAYSQQLVHCTAAGHTIYRMDVESCKVPWFSRWCKVHRGSQTAPHVHSLMRAADAVRTVSRVQGRLVGC